MLSQTEKEPASLASKPLQLVESVVESSPPEEIHGAAKLGGHSPQTKERLRIDAESQSEAMARPSFGEVRFDSLLLPPPLPGQGESRLGGDELVQVLTREFALSGCRRDGVTPQEGIQGPLTPRSIGGGA